MKKALFLFASFFWFSVSQSQTVATDPVFPLADQPVTLTIDATGTTLVGYGGDVWIWAWLPDCTSGGCDAPTNVNPATSGQSDALMTPLGDDRYSIRFTPTTFFNKPANEITRIGLKLKSVDWADGLQTDNDLLVEFGEGGLQIAFETPSAASLLVDASATIDIEVNVSQPADIILLVDNVEETSVSGATGLSYSLTAFASGKHAVKAMATTSSETEEASFTYVVRSNTVEQTLPGGVRPGINYGIDDTQVTLALEAPDKSTVYVVGDFNHWEIDPAYQMKRDGEIYWLEVMGLTPNEEYVFQYFVDESIKVADPYSDKVSDPNNDNFIDETTYPGLISYPDNDFVEGIASVIQTGQVAYDWEVANFEAPDNEDLVIYELLIRDFDEKHDYNAVIDRLDYLENLGINAIELMPIKEYTGNLSWGYNPSFFFAPDKYYGPKNELKRFIDECHKRGIAVILDMVLNHTHEDNPLAQLYWDEPTFKPAVDNPWLNVDAPHQGLTFFFDFDHESVYTQAYVDTVNAYWLNEYKVDGFRFDLTKGFTQKPTTGFGDWGAYDQSRVDILKRMSDEIWKRDSEAYVIFEHLSDNSEEKVLADYGIMLWGNMNHNYNQNTMGYTENSDLDWAYHGTRGWNEPNLISYMESHDEERLVYRNVTFGNTSGGHNTKLLPTALERVKAAAAFYFTIPGPKMVWQFGELGYDVSINEGGRTGEKPIPWASADDGLDYDNNADRIKLYKTFSELIKLKTSYEVFNTTDFSWTSGNTLLKKINLTSQPYTPNPTSTDEMNVHIVVNFDVFPQDISATFQHTGTWYHYFSLNDELEVTDAQMTINLQPGEFRVYTDFRLEDPEAELMTYVRPIAVNSLTATTLSDQDIELDWASTSTITTGFKVFASKAGGSFEEVADLEASNFSFLHGQLDPNTSYTYYVVAYNDFGQSVSTEVEGTTDETAMAPVAPTDLFVTTSGTDNNAVLTWSHDTMDELGFSIERSEGSQEGTYEIIATVTKDILTYTDEQIEIGKTYFYRVVAFRGSASSGYSNVASVLLTGISQNSFFHSFTLAPNPVQGAFTVSLNEAVTGKPGFALYDIYGKLIKVSPVLVAKNKYRFLTESLPKGVYMLKVNVSGKGYTSRFVKE